MFCPRCGSTNGDDVIFCRGCGLDLVEVRVAMVPGTPKVPATRGTITGRREKRLRAWLDRSDIYGGEDMRTLEEKAICLRSRALMGLLIGGGFAVLSYYTYLAPPIGGIFWMLPVAFTIFFLSTAIARFTQANAVRSLAVRSAEPERLAEPRETLFNPARSNYETGDLTQPHSVTDATTRHLRPNDRELG